MKLFLVLLLFVLNGCVTYEQALRDYNCKWVDNAEAHGWCCEKQLPDPCYLQNLRDGTHLTCQ